MAKPGLALSHLFAEKSCEADYLAAGCGIWSLRRAEVPRWLAGIGSARRLFHWGLGPVEAQFKSAFLEEKLDVLLSREPIDLFSFDLGPSARFHQQILPSSPPLTPSDIFRQTESALKFIRHYYQGPLAAENYNYYPTGLYDHICEPGFIRAYLDEFGLGLTLDLAHAAVTAHNLDLELHQYLEELPLDKTVEIHISRPWLPKNKKLWAVDAHKAPGAREWEVLAKIIKNSNIADDVPVFVEYYSNLGKLMKVHDRLTAALN